MVILICPMLVFQLREAVDLVFALTHRILHSFIPLLHVQLSEVLIPHSNEFTHFLGLGKDHLWALSPLIMVLK